MAGIQEVYALVEKGKAKVIANAVQEDVYKRQPMYASAWTQRSRREIRDPQQPVSVIMWKPEFREARL